MIKATQISKLRFVAVAALAGTMLAGCGANQRIASASSSPAPTVAAAHDVMSLSQTEEAVAANPRDAAMRVALGQAYLKAGRFVSAATTFNDAMELGDNSARTALSLALASIASGKNRDAIALLDDWRDSIPSSDLGLALALAGETTRGIAIMSTAMQADESPKLRQNLAFAYALDGHYREARLLMERDIPANQIDKRLQDWASRARPEDFQKRIAALLDVPVRADPGQPVALALNMNASGEQMAAEAAAGRPELAIAANGELPAVPGAPEQVAERTVVTPVEAAPAAAAPAVEAAPAPVPVQSNFAVVSQPVVQPLPVSETLAPKVPVRAHQVAVAAPKPQVSVVTRPAAKVGTHRAQLGAFSSPQGARRAWGIFAARNPELRNYRMVITQANVNGKQFWRVAAAGFDARSAQGMCSSVKSRGGVCFAYAGATPPVGAGMPTRANALQFGGANQKARRR